MKPHWGPERGGRSVRLDRSATARRLPTTRSETAAEDHLDDEPIGGSGETGAHPEVELPARVHVEGLNRVELMLLLGGGGKVADRPQRAVVLDSRTYHLRQVVAHLGGGGELDARLRAWALEALLEGRVDREVPAAPLLVDDWTDLERPGVGGEIALLLAELERETEPHRQVPFFRSADARAEMVAHPPLTLVRNTSMNPRVEVKPSLEHHVPPA